MPSWRWFPGGNQRSGPWTSQKRRVSNLNPHQFPLFSPRFPEGTSRGFLRVYQPVAKPTRRSTGDPSRLNRVAARRSSLRFGRNTRGIPPSRALSAGRLTGLGAHVGFTTGWYPLRAALVLPGRSQQPVHNVTRAWSPDGHPPSRALAVGAPPGKRSHPETWFPPAAAPTPLVHRLPACEQRASKDSGASRKGVRKVGARGAPARGPAPGPSRAVRQCGGCRESRSNDPDGVPCRFP